MTSRQFLPGLLFVLLYILLNVEAKSSDGFTKLYEDLNSKMETIYFPGGPKTEYYRPKIFERLEKAESIHYPRYRPYASKNAHQTERKYTPANYDRKKQYRTYKRRKIQPKIKETYYRPPEPRKYPASRLKVDRTVSRALDPCVRRDTGQYDLDGEFSRYFPHADSICNFVKCANKKAFLNQCGTGTRNNDYGGGFCSVLDLDGYCGKSVYSKTVKKAAALNSLAKDPCRGQYDGQYVLNKDFKKHFPYVDNMCYFVKCANKKAFLNPCGPGTRNKEDGSGYCSVLDLEGYCGRTVHDRPLGRRKRKKGRVYSSADDRNYREYSHGN